jgi:hypothetical protein
VHDVVGGGGVLDVAAVHVHRVHELEEVRGVDLTETRCLS